jgi:hypothetical protein
MENITSPSVNRRRLRSMSVMPAGGVGVFKRTVDPFTLAIGGHRTYNCQRYCKGTVLEQATILGHSISPS